MGWITYVSRLKLTMTSREKVWQSEVDFCPWQPCWVINSLCFPAVAFLYCSQGHSLNLRPITWSTLISSRALASSLIFFLTSWKCCILLHLTGTEKIPLLTFSVFYMGSGSHGPSIPTTHKNTLGFIHTSGIQPGTLGYKAPLQRPSIYASSIRNHFKCSAMWTGS